jgi:alpha-N-arabinofuranosidase
MNGIEFLKPGSVASGMRIYLWALSVAFLLPFTSGRAQSPATVLAVDLAQPGKPISSDLIGIFFEDINYAADGGLYAELVQNRSFEYGATEQITWNSMTSWEQITRDGGRGSLSIADAVPVHPNNPHYAVIETQQPGAGVGLLNSGFDGIVVREGEEYDFSVFARQLFTGNRWGGTGELQGPAQLVVRLESKEQAALGEATLEVSGRDWQRLSATITATNSDSSGRLVVLSLTRGGVALDEISLFPRQTFKQRANGLRADLAQAIADLKPRFMRFPGGCLVHGGGLGNMYRWKDSIGPIEQRRGQRNIWGYHQSLGLGYFEYFQFCEDIGAKPLPVVPAGVCCQNADHQGGTGQRGLPLDAMPDYIQEVLDLIEWANGPTNSTWGAKRTAAGHPEPFHLQYLGVGNEEHITPVFSERFKLIHDAVKAKHPGITVIGTVGPFHSGADFDAGWKIANEFRLEMVDEHYYEKPEWFLNNLQRYDGYDRAKSQVYVGEYAAHESNRANTLRSALAEAAYLTSLERNGDIVRFTSYAPLLAKQGRTQWRPDMIYFDNTRLLRSVNYFVQQMFGQNQGDVYLNTSITPATTNLAVSCVRDSRSGDVILKIVNTGSSAQSLRVEMSGAKGIATEAVKTELKGNPAAVNSFEAPTVVVPRDSSIPVGNSFTGEAPAHSLTIFRFGPGGQ